LELQPATDTHKVYYTKTANLETRQMVVDSLLTANEGYNKIEGHYYSHPPVNIFRSLTILFLFLQAVSPSSHINIFTKDIILNIYNAFFLFYEN